jgi:SGNH domain (fused to AT3 domains)
LGRDIPARPNCRSFNEAAFAAILARSPKVVVVEGRTEPAFDRTIEAMVRSGIRVIAIGYFPRYRDSVPVLVAQRLTPLPFWEFSSADVLPPAVFDIDRAISAYVSGMPGVRFVSLLKAGCPMEKYPMAINNVPLHWDTEHFTREGSEYYSPFLFNAIKDEVIGDPIKIVEATAGLH